MQLHGAHDRRALIPTEALGPPGWMSEMSSFGGRNHLYRTESAACFFAVESLGPAFLTVHSLGQYKNEKRLPFPPSHSKASSAKQ